MVLSKLGRADLTSAGLDAGVEASEPHDFAVREGDFAVLDLRRLS